MRHARVCKKSFIIQTVVAVLRCVCKSASFLRRLMGRTFDKYRFLISFNQKLNFVRNYSSNRKPDAFIKPLTKKLVLSELENMLINFIVFV